MVAQRGIDALRAAYLPRAFEPQKIPPKFFLTVPLTRSYEVVRCTLGYSRGRVLK
mgnify:CR=1 FL=1